MKTDQLNSLISRIKDIPTLPSVVMQINSVLRDKLETIEGISGIIEKDTALTSKILRIANSSYYGFSNQVDSLSRAITILGFNTVRNLAVTVSLFKIYSNSKSPAFDIKGLWFHSLGSAIASKALLVKNPYLREKAFICGLLHDIGKLIIYINLPAEMDSIITRLHVNPDLSMHEAEKEVLGFTHCDVGGQVAEKWHLPIEFRDVIKYHHKPKSNKDWSVLVYAVYAGNELAKALGLGKSMSAKAGSISHAAWKIVGVTEQGLPQVLQQIEKDFDEMSAFWDKK